MHTHPALTEATLAHTERRLALAAERHRLLAEAAHARTERRAQRPATAEVITIRRATDADAKALAALARLDTTRRLDGEIIVALVEKELVAAMSLDDCRIVSDPFRPTAAVRDLLVLRHGQLAACEARTAGRLSRSRWSRRANALRAAVPLRSRG